MPYNGSGTFTQNGADYPAVATTLIQASKRNNIDADVATGLSTAICKDGQTTITANIPMATFKLTGLGLGSTANDSVRLAQVQAGAMNLLGTVAGTNSITAVAAPVIGAYAAGQTFRFIPANTNTGATTINIDGVAAKNIFCGGAACGGGEIRQNTPCEIFYDGTQFQIIGPYVGGNLPGTVTVTRVGAAPAAVFSNAPSGAGTTTQQVWNKDTAGDSIFTTFYTEAAATERGSIDYNRGAAAVRYNTTSDARLKTKNGTARYDPTWIHRVAGSIFDVTWKANGYRTDTFVAQDLHRAEPDAVKTGDDGPLTEHSAIWGADPSKLVAKLILEVAALRGKVDALKANS